MTFYILRKTKMYDHELNHTSGGGRGAAGHAHSLLLLIQPCVTNKSFDYTTNSFIPKKKKSILFYITYINTKINNELWQFFFPQKEKKQWPTKWIIFDKVNCQFEIQMIYRYKKQEVNVSNSYWLNVLYYITISGHDKQYVQDQIKWSKAILQKKNRR